MSMPQTPAARTMTPVKKLQTENCKLKISNSDDDSYPRRCATTIGQFAICIFEFSICNSSLLRHISHDRHHYDVAQCDDAADVEDQMSPPILRIAIDERHKK